MNRTKKDKPMMQTNRGAQSKAGFSMAEVILVVSVMAILVSISAPPLIDFIKRRDIQYEENTMNEILKAMKAYLADRNTLPVDTNNNWATEFGRYANMSANQILMDTWGNERRYVRMEVTETFLGSEMQVFYVSLHSAGPNRRADGGATTVAGEPVTNSGIAVSGNAFEAVGNAGWWKNTTGGNDEKIAKFASALPARDDLMIRFTDYSEKIERYNTSLERLKGISMALESYSSTKYNERVVFCMANPTHASCTPRTPETYIYYPRSSNGGPVSYYSSEVAADLTTYNSGNPINTSTTHATRRTHMINLMRILGLPDSYCCSAMEVIPGTRNEMPFYYFSNPRARTTAGCGPRPDPRTDRTLPARITVRNETDACG